MARSRRIFTGSGSSQKVRLQPAPQHCYIIYCKAVPPMQLANKAVKYKV